MNSGDICARLRAYLPAQEYALFFEVPNGTGANIRGYADAVAMSLWPSRGHTVIGYEIKVSASDLNRELAAPEKADVVGKYCDHWYLVTPPGLVAKAKYPLPPTWGLLEATGPTLRSKITAPRLTPVGSAAPREMPRSFVATLLRRAQTQAAVPMEAEIKRRVAAETAQRVKEEEARKARAAAGGVTLRDNVRAFEEASGIKISDRWSSGKQIAEDLLLARRLREYGGEAFAPILHQVELTAKLLRDIQEKLK